MKHLKLFSTLTLVIFFTSGLLASDRNEVSPCCLGELNRTMQSRLGLSAEEMRNVLQLNQEYWFSRKIIFRDSDKIGKNTALIACWDKWVQRLSGRLTAKQMDNFLRWQSTVDILSEAPF